MALSTVARRLSLRAVLVLFLWAAVPAVGAQSASAEGIVEGVIGRAAGTLSQATGAVPPPPAEAGAASAEAASPRSSEPGAGPEPSSAQPETAVAGSGRQTSAGRYAATGRDGAGHATSAPAPGRRDSAPANARGGPGRVEAPASGPAGSAPAGRGPGPARRVLITDVAPVARAVLDAGRAVAGAGASAAGQGPQGGAYGLLDAGGLLGGAAGVLERAGGLFDLGGAFVGALLQQTVPAVGASGEGPVQLGYHQSPASVAGAAPLAIRPAESGVGTRAVAAHVRHAPRARHVRDRTAIVGGGSPGVPAAQTPANEVGTAPARTLSSPVAHRPAAPGAPGSGTTPAVAGAAAAGTAGAAIVLLLLLGLSPPGVRRRPRERDHAGLADPFALLLCRPG